MEAEDWTTARVRLQKVRESRLHPGGLVAKRKRAEWCRQSFGDAFAVFLGLRLHAGEGRALLLRLDHPGRHAVHEEKIVGFTVAVPQRKLPDGNARAGVDIGVCPILDDPARLLEQVVDRLPGFLLGRHSVSAIISVIRRDAHPRAVMPHLRKRCN